jgi:hypothetical protein
MECHEMSFYSVKRNSPSLVFGCCIALIVAVPVSAAVVIVPDNGFGTANMPILADYVSQTPMQMINGVIGGVININAILETPTVYAEQPGGTLGGTKSAGGGSGMFTWQMQGTGAFAAYTRTLTFPVKPGPGVVSFVDPAFNVTGADFEVHAAPRTLNAPFQSFDTDMFQLFGQRTNPADADPDFDLLRVTAGTNFGMPSPGHTNVLQLGPNWLVDSFFDLTYRIDFVGKAGGQFGGMSGSTTGTVRISLGESLAPVPELTSCLVWCIGMWSVATVFSRRRS